MDNGPDPHDQLLLTKRPTTIVTQATSAGDNMPTPYGSQEDEEALFAEVGSDNGIARNALAADDAAAGTQGRMPGTEREAEVITVVGNRAPGISLGVLAAVGLGLGWLLSRRR